MIITVNAGHTPTSPGASGYLDEVKCARDVRDRVITELNSRGHSVYDCTAPDYMAYPDELNEQVRIANDGDAKLAVSIHLNAGGGTGTECYYWSADSWGCDVATRMSSNLSEALGIPDRGAKTNDGLGFLAYTGMTAVLLEVCFVDTLADADAYHAAPWGYIVNAICNAIEGDSWGKPADVPEPPEPDTSGQDTTVLVNDKYRVTIEEV